ncbi:hypothetical protein [Marivivens aquimaris]|uniref:hypothetical protein n=1 Tax=Marivivens aquimaris TaxID=2774876 RepID=UPI00187E694F|nr:hypothetical protein [Marivivens aquimaris]
MQSRANENSKQTNKSRTMQANHSDVMATTATKVIAVALYADRRITDDELLNAITSIKKSAGLDQNIGSRSARLIMWSWKRQCAVCCHCAMDSHQENLMLLLQLGDRRACWKLSS